jgi:hypothetical protein
MAYDGGKHLWGLLDGCDHALLFSRGTRVYLTLPEVNKTAQRDIEMAGLQGQGDQGALAV